MSYTIYTDFCLAGRKLDLLEEAYITISSEGYFEKVSSEAPKSQIYSDFEDCLILPTFINAHTHVGDSFAKEMGYQYSIEEVVESPHGLKHRLLADASKDELISGIRDACLEMLSSGTSMFADFREGGLLGMQLLDRVIKDLPIKAVRLGRPNQETTLEELIPIVDGVGLTSTNNYTDEELKEISSKCKKNNKIVAVHVSETENEKKISYEKFGYSDVKRALDVLEADVLVHLTHADQEDMQLLKGREVVCCPRANAYFGVGFPPVEELVNAGTRVCLGTDNVMANSLDLFREMEFLGKTLRGRHGKNALHSKKIIEMITVNPADLFNLSSGWIEEGRCADFIVLNLDAPNMRPVHDIYHSVVHRAKPENIDFVYIKGKKVFEREHI
ncbi:MAG: amidohydrolase family protein [Candidatus Jordarchaeum sp.]|uniref:amidohydrolase family protein n=1 Tax=Candidatus Jordarchaeum sp. TaxID=2823881 RepID=UPI00404AE001